MINQRATRPSKSVESLRQLSISNIKGVDETKSPTDLQSVFSATNFTNNPDGSFSIRKPLLLKKDWTKVVKKLIKSSHSNDNDITSEDTKVFKVVPLYTGKDVMVMFQYTFKNSSRVAFAIYNTESDTAYTDCNLVWRDVDDVEHSRRLFGMHAKYFAVADYFMTLSANCEYTNTTTATLLSNCTVYLNSGIFSVYVDEREEKFPLVDYDLYYPGTTNRQIHMPRYVRILQDREGFWNFEVISPLPNIAGSLNNSDATLDSPYAFRDNYNASVPAVKSIVPYVYTTMSKGKPVPVTMENDTVKFQSSKLQSGYVDYRKTLYDGDYVKVAAYRTFNVSDSGDGVYSLTNTVNLYITPKCPVMISINEADVHIMWKKSIGMTDEHVTDARFVLELSEEGRATLSEKLKEPVEIAFRTTVTDVVLGEQQDLMMHNYCNIGLAIEGVADVITELNISEYTESVKEPRFRFATSLPVTPPDRCILKAFCNFPKVTPKTGDSEFPEYYATWMYSLDGISWTDAISAKVADPNGYSNSISITSASEKPIEGLETAETESGETHLYVPFKSTDGPKDSHRIDVLNISKEIFENYFTNAIFRFKIVLARKTSDKSDYEIAATYGQMDYVPIFTSDGEYAYHDLGNSSLGKKCYHNGRIYSYGDASFRNHVYVSYPGEFVTPIENIIDLNASEDNCVTSVTPWKDYLFISTAQASYLSQQVSEGFLTKTVNTAVGVLSEDADTVATTLNGIVFKSGSQIYMLYPNMYAGDDSVINVTEISKPVEDYLYNYRKHDTYKPFAFSTESEYVLILPEQDCTKCLKYDYSARVWNCLQYPVVLQNYHMYNLSNVVLFGEYGYQYVEYFYDKSVAEAYKLTTSVDGIVDYGDILTDPENGVLEELNKALSGFEHSIDIRPIEFELDTGQKTGQILTKKQFVETKIVVATDTQSPSIRMELTVHVGGGSSVITKDVSTDSAFWKMFEGGMVLNTDSEMFSNEARAARGVLRQAIVRYSGKGNSVRHIFRGTSSSNFRLYETYIRYKLLNTKQ